VTNDICSSCNSLTCLNFDDVSSQAALRSARYDRNEFACDYGYYAITDYHVLCTIGTHGQRLV
jgi:hypothetical protein